MHSYSEFPNDVKIAFLPLVNQYNLKFKAEGICSVDLENKYCRINFNMDRYNLQGVIFKKGDSTSFAITRIASYQNPKDFEKEEIPKTEYGDKKSIKKLLHYFSMVTNKYLGEVLNGDFSWFDQVKKEDEYERQLVSLIMGSEMEYEHPISQKFWSGDKTWKADIEKYIKQNKISIKKASS